MQCMRKAWNFVWYSSNRNVIRDVEKEHESHLVDVKLFFKKIPVEQRGVKYEITVMDTGQTHLQHPVVLLLHGAPGGSRDFVKMMPFLLKEKLRIISPNLPGFGVTNVSERDLARIPRTTEATTDLVKQILKQLNINSVRLIISHSQGSMTAYKLCAEQNVEAAAFINATGYYPHRGGQPFWHLQVLTSIFNFAPTRRVVKQIFSSKMRKLGFSKMEASTAVTVYRSVAGGQFYKAKEYGAKIAAKKLPVLFALSKSDKIVECERALDLLKNVMAASNNCIVSYDENRKPSHHVETKPEDWYVRALLFKTGGHIVHRAHQDIVIEEIAKLLRFIQHRPK